MRHFFALFLLHFIELVSAYTELSHESLTALGQLGLGDRLSLDPTDQNSHFVHFNTTRIPGTSESIYIREYIKSHFDQMNKAHTVLQWVVEEDTFTERGFNFSSIVATLTPPGSRNTQYLLLAVHYDSKIDPDFIGAIDSAVSCGILLDIAEKLTPSLITGFDDDELALDIGLRIVFFDGEEAIDHWTDEDSIYGARHLHAEWEKSGELGAIDLFVLLDLLGAKDQNYVPSFFPQTQAAYAELSRLERRLQQVYPQVIQQGSEFLAAPSDTFEREYYGTLGDDHLPFLRSGVSILHMIAHPFPSVWHTPNDDFDCVDPVAVQHWTLLFAAFVLEYLDVPLHV